MFIVFNCQTSISQTFEKVFPFIEKTYNDSTFDYPSKAINYKNRLHSSISLLLNTYLEMYESTFDVKYLDLFIIQAKLTIDRRDDNLKKLYLDKPENERIIISNIEKSKILEGGQLPTLGYMAWSGYNEAYYDPDEPQKKIIDAYWGTELVSNGIISFPLIKFSYLIKQVYPFLKTKNVPKEISEIDISTGDSITTYEDFAELLKIKINQTIHDHFGQYWSFEKECYMGTCPTGPSQSPSNINYHTSIGRSAAYLYQIFKKEKNDSLCKYYNYLTSKILQRLTNPKGPSGFTNENHIISWKYTSRNGSYDDIAHGILTMEFVDLCNQFKIYNYPDKTYLIAPDELIFDFANTFKEKLVKLTQKYWLNISGDDKKSANQPLPIGDNQKSDEYRVADQYSNAGRFLFLAKHYPDIYTIIADYFYEFPLYGSASSQKYLPGATNQLLAVDAIAGLAQISKNPKISNHLDIQSVLRKNEFRLSDQIVEKCEWNGITSGNFDGDTNTIEFATIKKGEKGIQLYKYNSNNQKITPKEKYNNFLEDSDKIASGNIDLNNLNDEIVTYNKISKEIFIHQSNNNPPYSFFITENIASLTVGNMDNLSGDEIITISEEKGEISIYKFDGKTLKELIIYNRAFPEFQISNPSEIAVGNLDNDPSNGLEIITINNNHFDENNIRIVNFNYQTNRFYNSIPIFSNSTDSYSNWNGIAVGDYNKDGIDEFFLHRDYDGDFFLFYQEAGEIKNVCKDYIPVRWDMKTIGTLKVSNEHKDHLIALRNFDSDIFIYEPYLLPKKIAARSKTIPSETNIKIHFEAFDLSDEMYNLAPYTTNFNIITKYTIESSSYLTIDLFDFLGNNITTLNDSFIESGTYSTTIDTTELKNGIYFIQMKTDKDLKKVKLVIEK